MTEVAHVVPLDLLGGRAEAAPERAQLRRLERDHDRLAVGDALLDERGDPVEESFGPCIEDGFVTEGVGREHDRPGKPSPLCQASRMWKIGLLTLALVAGALAAPARAADPGRWKETGTTTLPIQYYQGVTVDPARNFYFDGIFVGRLPDRRRLHADRRRR